MFGDPVQEVSELRWPLSYYLFFSYVCSETLVKRSPGLRYFILCILFTVRNLRPTKKHFFEYPLQMLTNLGPEWCGEHDGAFRFLNFVLVFQKLYVKIRKTLFRYITTSITPFIYSHLHKSHIASIFHK